MAFWALVAAARTRRDWASSFSETARPAAASEGVTILEPEERRFSERPSISWLRLRLRAAVMAWMLVLMTLMVVGGLDGQVYGLRGETGAAAGFKGSTGSAPERGACTAAAWLLAAMAVRTSLRKMAMSRGASMPIFTTSPSMRVMRISIESPITMASL